MKRLSGKITKRYSRRLLAGAVLTALVAIFAVAQHSRASSETDTGRKTTALTADANLSAKSDVQPRPSGDGFVDADDIQQIRRFAVGLDAPIATELMSADGAPRAFFGDGLLDSDDAQQARRYAVGIDAAANAPATDSTVESSDKESAERAAPVKEFSRNSTSRTSAPQATAAFRIDNQTTTAGQTIIVPVRVDTVGDEYGYTFSLSYNQTVLMNPVVTIGNSGGDVVFNSNSPGKIGFSVTTFPGGPIAPGTNKILVNVQFTVANNAPSGTMSPINFTDDPARRKASPNDPNMPITQPTYTGGNVMIASAAPAITRAFRVDNQTVNAGQVIVVPVRVDANGDEFGYTFSLSYNQMFLTNPVVTIGNSGGDVVFNSNNPGQIGFSVTSFAGGPIAAGTNKILVNVRFTVAGNAPVGTVTPIGFTDTPARRKASPNDPNMPITQPTYTDGNVTINGATPAATRAFRVLDYRSSRSMTLNVPVFVDAVGDEFGYTFSLSYDATVLGSPVVTIGNSGGDVVFNANNPGQIGFSVTSFPGGPIAPGTNKILVNVQFTVLANAPFGTTPLNFTDTPARRKASPNDPNMPITQPTYTNGSVTISGPTAATSTVAGRVTDGEGRGISHVAVTINATSGETRRALTNGFGYYSFSEVASGETYILSVNSKGYTFEPSSQVVNVSNNLTDVNFVAN